MITAGAGCGNADTEGTNTMMDQVKERSAIHTLLPFGQRTLDSVEIVYKVISGETGGGMESITIRGTGDVVIMRQANQDAKQEALSGRVGSEAVQRLLELLDVSNFTAKAQEYFGEEPLQGATVISLRGEGLDHSVALIGVGLTQLDRLIGAVKLVAGLARPEVTQGTFFEML